MKNPSCFILFSADHIIGNLNFSLFTFHFSLFFVPLHSQIHSVKRNEFCLIFALVAELVDAPDLGSGISDVQVRVLSGAQRKGMSFFDIPFSCLGGIVE